MTGPAKQRAGRRAKKSDGARDDVCVGGGAAASNGSNGPPYKERREGRDTDTERSATKEKMLAVKHPHRMPSWGLRDAETGFTTVYYSVERAHIIIVHEAPSAQGRTLLACVRRRGSRALVAKAEMMARKWRPEAGRGSIYLEPPQETRAITRQLLPAVKYIRFTSHSVMVRIFVNIMSAISSPQDT
jgi:hypothetical protein